MKTISFELTALLIVASTTAIALESGKKGALPTTGWYETVDSFMAPNIPAMSTDPLLNPTFDFSRFQGYSTPFNDITCGSLNVKVCAAYFRASDDQNIRSPASEGNIYFLAGGRP